MGLRGRALPEPWPTPPVRTSLEMEASWLDPDVQELLGPEDLGAYGLTSDAASLGCSERIDMSQEIVRSRLLCDSSLTAVGAAECGPSGAGHPPRIFAE